MTFINLRNQGYHSVILFSKINEFFDLIDEAKMSNINRKMTFPSTNCPST